MRFLISAMAFAARSSGHATRTIWHPASAKRLISATVASTSCVFVVVMLWMTTSLLPPIVKGPTLTGRVFVRCVISLTCNRSLIVVAASRYNNSSMVYVNLFYKLHCNSVFAELTRN
ncbi:Uncharacterised protein [Streptococcus pneumoniae]|nr:Uncharacterised protein [Streptococcus pneumoniae]